MMEELTKTSRILSVYHLFLNCQEVSFQELIYFWFVYMCFQG